MVTLFEPATLACTIRMSQNATNTKADSVSKVSHTMKTAKHPTGITITFDPAAHRYTDSLGRGPYDSVTSIVSALFAPFDQDGQIAAGVAHRTGKDPATVQAEWSAKGDAACTLGTRTHETAEATVLGQPPPHAPTSPRERAAFAAAYSAATQIRSASATVHPEVILADPSSLTAGTCDILAVRRRDSALILGDYKTNEHIEPTSRYKTRALPPYQHLDDCHLTRYSVQLHLYAWILRAHYLAPSDALQLVLIHLQPDNPEPQWLEVIDMSAEAADIMQKRRDRMAMMVDGVRGMKAAGRFKDHAGQAGGDSSHF
jgi:hypothetical protein